MVSFSRNFVQRKPRFYIALTVTLPLNQSLIPFARRLMLDFTLSGRLFKDLVLFPLFTLLKLSSEGALLNPAPLSPSLFALASSSFKPAAGSDSECTP